MIYRLGGRLENVIKSAAADAGVTAVVDEVFDEFYGHEPCSSGFDPYVHGLVLGGGGLISGNSFHPRPEGALAYQRAVEEGLDSLFATGADRPVLWAS